MKDVRDSISPDAYEELLYYVQNPREGDVWALSHQRCAMAPHATSRLRSRA